MESRQNPQIAIWMTILGVFMTERVSRFNYYYFILVFSTILFALLNSC